MNLRNALVRLIEAWALLGGALLALVVPMNVASVLGTAFYTPVPGDFELTQIGVAVGVFAFLPYVQLTRANVSADIFTARASERWIARFSLLGSLSALLFSGVTIWRMYGGMLDQKAYGYTTAIVQFPHWIAFVPILISLALLAVAALITLAEDAAASR